MKKTSILFCLLILAYGLNAQLRFSVQTQRDPAKKTKANVLTLVDGSDKVDYTWNDTTMRDPETTKVLFEKQKGDTLYALLYVATFSKVTTTSSNGKCVAGKEKRLFFVKWSRTNNQAKWKNKSIESCLLNVTLMSNENEITSWDKSSPLLIKTHKANAFVDLTFDPSLFWEGIRSGL